MLHKTLIINAVGKLKHSLLKGVYFAIVLSTCILSITSLVEAQETSILRNSYFSFRTGADTSGVIMSLKEAELLKKNNSDSALRVLQTCLNTSKQLLFASGMTSSIRGLSLYYQNLGDYDKLIELYKNAIAFCHLYPSLMNIIPKLYVGMGYFYCEQGDLVRAFECYHYADILSESLSIPKPLALYTGMGDVLIRLRRYNEALYYLDKAEVLVKTESGDTIEKLIAVYGTKGAYYYSLKQWQPSLHYYFKVLKIAQQNDRHETQFKTLVMLGELCRSSGNDNQGLQYLLQAQSMQFQPTPIAQTYFLNVIGRIHINLRRYKSAEQYFRQALIIAKTEGLKNQIKDIYYGLGIAFYNAKQFKKSHESFESYWLYKDSVESSDLKKKIVEWGLKYKAIEKDKEIAQHQVKISQQKYKLYEKNLWLTGISSGTLLLIALLIILLNMYRINKHKNKLQTKQMSLLQQRQEIEHLKAVIIGEEKERERIARDLHDGVGGMLAALNMNLSDALEKEQDLNDKIRLNKLACILQDTTAELRKTAHNLLPDILTQHSLEDALMLYCEQISISNTINIHFQFHAHIEDLDKSIELILYRISQELLQNIFKHSKATVAWLMIKQLSNKLSIIVEDNGTGFRPEEHKDSYGLLNLQHRVKALQGNINISSAISRGTTVHVEFDINKLKKKSND